jgi:hypothetical protein
MRAFITQTLLPLIICTNNSHTESKSDGMGILKIIIRLAREKIVEIRTWIFIRSKAKHSIIFSRTINHQNAIDLICIAYNQDSLIKLQSKLLKKFVTDEITYHVVDNSTNQDTSSLLVNFSIKNKINYYKLPTNPSNFPSISHGCALNWALHNITAKSNNIYYGFLDHDIFPVKKTSVIRELKGQAFYGHQQKRRNLIYLWPGFCFFDKRKMNPKELNFLPIYLWPEFFFFDKRKKNPKELNFLPDTFLKLDTGGRLFKKIKRVSISDIKWPQHSYIRILNENKTIQENCVEKIDDWIHLMNGGEWKKTNDKKKKLGLIYVKKLQKF